MLTAFGINVPILIFTFSLLRHLDVTDNKVDQNVQKEMYYHTITSFEVFTVVIVKIVALWVVTPCNVVGRCWYLKGTYCLCLQG
jgi:hypothetical protein